MRGLVQHFLLTLKLNFRSLQTVAYGYFVPLFFLIAFGTLFRSGKPPLVREMGQLLTITILGGACFGMPTAMVAERERGVWRRYRLLPTALSGIVLSTMIARFVLVLSAGILQVFLARAIYGTTFPQHPIQMLISFVFVSFAFLGMGLVIAMAAENVPAVQALGQAIFLPMIIIGGVGVPLRNLPDWAQHVTLFLPGRYAVEALQACMDERGLGTELFALVALTGIGTAACIAGTKLFRWDVSEKIPVRSGSWIAAALLMWFAVGLLAESTGQLRTPERSVTENPLVVAATNPTSQRIGVPWEAMTRVQADAVSYDDLPGDRETELPVAANLDELSDEEMKRLEGLLTSFYNWDPAKTDDPAQRVRNLLSIASITDLAADPLEGAIAYSIFKRIQDEIPKEQLIQILTWIIHDPDAGKAITDIQELDILTKPSEADVRTRTMMYSKKLLYRVLHGKPPPIPAN